METLKNLDNKKIHALTVEALENVLPQVQFNLMDSNAYYRYVSKRIGVIVESTLKALRYQNKNTKFKPQRFEAGFRKTPNNSEELIAQPLITKQGIPVNIRGQIDRIDAYTKNDKSYINIIDYKSSNPSAKLDLKKVYYGKQMQMMTYMDIALQNAQRLGLSNEIKPGGLLYFHVHDERLSFKDWGELEDDALTQDKLEQAFLKEYKLRGLVNSDMDVVDALDIRLEEISKSDIVPVSLKKDGSIGSRGSSVADETTIHKFIKHNKDNFIKTATNIMEGHTEVAPLKFDDQLPCQFCNFQSVCHVDTIIDSKHYRHVDETIDPIKAIQDVELEAVIIMNNIPIKPKDAQWTDAQWKSIYANGQDILVAAAAGSGKTAVLVERIIQKIIRDEIDVDKLLVVTFTNLSAREMKHRVDQRIQQASIENPNNEHLKNQRIKIHQAQISTLHSFCLKIIQQHYDVIDLDPNFRTISDVENVLLLEQSIDEVLEKHYDTPDIEFLTLVEQLSSDRNDDNFRDLLKRFYNFSIANPSPFEWLDSLVEIYTDDNKHKLYLDELERLSKIYIKAAYHTLLEAENNFLNCIEHGKAFRCYQARKI